MTSGDTTESVHQSPAPADTSRVSVLAVLGWIVLAIGLAVALVTAIGGLNRTVYSSATFVTSYLDALGRDDVSAALSMTGVDPQATEAEGAPVPSEALLRRGVIAQAPADIRIIDVVTRDDGTDDVTASYRLGADIDQSTFHVRPDESLYGLFDMWAFAEAPSALIDVSVENGALFTAGRLTLDTRATKSDEELADFSQSASYLALYPAMYRFGFESTLLAAEPVEVALADAGGARATLVDLPTAAFTDLVQDKVDEYLDECAEQHVLKPAGCPFGVDVDDRVISEPAWSISAYPTVSLTPGVDSFEMEDTTGAAHILVDAQSLFDGEYYTIDEDRPITLGLTVTISPDGTPAIQLR